MNRRSLPVISAFTAPQTCLQSGRFARWLAIAAVTTAAACATTSADFRMSNVLPDEAAIAGRLTILYNGGLFTQNCTATFGQRVLKMSADGIVLFRVQKGWTALERLDCKDGGMQHVRIRGAHFFARGDGRVTDFGDVMVIWEASGGFKMATLLGMVGAIVDGTIDDGVASIEVRPPSPDVRNAFRRQTGDEGRWVVQQLSQPSNAVLRAPAGASDPADLTPAEPAGQHGFFCTASPTGRDDLSVCERDHDACEHTRAVLARQGLAECRPAATAWCFAANARLRCFASQGSCEAQSQKRKGVSDLCGEQY